MIKATMGNIIKNLREEKRLTQLELAEKIAIKRTSVIAYESGNQAPTIETLVKFADFFGVSLDYLTGRTADKAIHQLPKIDKDRFPGYSEPEYKILGIIQATIDQILSEKDAKETVDAMVRIADREPQDEYKMLMIIFSKLVIEQYQSDMEKMRKKIENLESGRGGGD